MWKERMKRAQAQKGRMWVSEHTDRTRKPRTRLTIKPKREITHGKVINRSVKVAQSCGCGRVTWWWALACQGQGPGGRLSAV